MMLLVIPKVGFTTVRMPCGDSDMPVGSGRLVGARLNVPPRLIPLGNVVDRSTLTFVLLVVNTSEGDGSHSVGEAGEAGEVGEVGVGVGACALDGSPSSLPKGQPASGITHPNAPNFSRSRRLTDVIIQITF